MHNPKTLQQERMDVLEKLNNTICGVADDLISLQKENARLSQQLKLMKAQREVQKQNAAFWAEHLAQRNEEVDQLKARIAELEAKK